MTVDGKLFPASFAIYPISYIGDKKTNVTGQPLLASPQSTINI